MRIETAWKPLSGSQSLILSCPCDEILYEGTRGPGKTAAQLARFRRKVGIGYGSFWRGIIFDLEYKDLADLIVQSKRFFNAFEDGAKFLSSAADLKWVWPTGEELLFRHGKSEDDYWHFHGQEFPFIGFNELTKQKDDKLYEAMFSCRRSSFRPEDYPLPGGDLLPSIPLETFSTTNPFGVGHAWVKKRFITPGPRGKVQRFDQVVFNPKTQVEEVVTMQRVAVHGSWRENPYLPSEYIAGLMRIKDPNKKAAWVDGSWDVTAGGRFDDLWDERTHVVKPFNIPESWRVDRSHDWGESKPFSNLWWAESDGSTVEIDGVKKAYQSGTIFLIGEWYGCPPDELNKGLNMPSVDVAKGVKWIDGRLTGSDPEKPESVNQGQANLLPGICKKVSPGPADSSIYNTGDNELSIGQKMAKQGVRWVEANKKPGSRINGATLFRDMLKAAVDARLKESGLPEDPAFYVFDYCRGWIGRVPILPRDSKNPDDVDCWVAGTMVSTPFGAMPIEAVRIGDLVCTPIGSQRVTKSYASGSSKVVRVVLNEGSILQGTPHHPVMVSGVGLVPLSQLKAGMILESEEGIGWLMSLSIEGLITGNTKVGAITNRALVTLNQGLRRFTGKFIKTQLAPSLMGSMSIIKTAIGKTIIRQTLRLYPRLTTPGIIKTSQNMRQSKVAQSGQEATLEKLRLEQMQKRCGKTRLIPNFRAQIVKALLLPSITGPNIAVPALKSGAIRAAKASLALFAARSFITKHILPNRSKAVVLSVDGCCEKQPVYNITVDTAGLYFANGVLSSNTDAEDHDWDGTRYRVLAGKRGAMTLNMRTGF